MRAIRIGSRMIGPGEPCFIVAEAGVNHNGDVGLARELVRAARDARADCVKFQTFKAERLVTAAAPKAKYQLEVTDRSESQLEMLRKLELGVEAHKEIMALCRELNIRFLSTPHGKEDIELLEQIGVTAYKTASMEVVEPAFLRAVASKGKPMFVSTGMATLAEVEEAVRVIRETGNDQFALLQCTTSYPSRTEDANLRAIPAMASAFGTIMGYSDHTQTETACLVAVALGASVIEKHLTLDKTLPGPDHSSSADPREFKHLVAGIRAAESALGSGRKEPCEAEIANMLGMRRSLVASRPIGSGEVIGEEMLTFKRPATGLKPALLAEVVGRVATRDIAPDEIITWEMCGERR